MMNGMAGANGAVGFKKGMCALGLATLAALANAGEPNAQRLNHFVGAAGESIPIQVPPYHGIEPRLSLSYSSEARNGFAGMGWNLTGFSVIERGNGLYGFPRNEDTQVFTLDGQGVHPCPASSSYPSCATGGTHYTHQESYLRIKKVSDVLWQVFGKDGTRTDFEPIYTELTLPTFRLGQKRVVDTHGNEVLYTWAVNAGGINGNTYPSSISYNGYTIDFFREARPDLLTRPGLTDVMRAGDRLKSVVVKRGNDKIRAYKLTYTQSAATGKSLLTSVQMFGKDASVDVTGTITAGSALPAQTFAYQPDAAVASFTGDVQMSSGSPPTPAGTTENVVWSYRTNTTPTGSGHTLTADAGVPDGWDKVGYSSRALSTGVGHLEFTYSGGQGYGVYLGAYGVYVGSGSMTAVGPGIGSNGPFALPANALVRVEVAPGAILFKVGGTTVFSHSATPAYPMVVFASFYRAGDAVTDARLTGTLVNYFSVDCGGSPRFSGDFNGDGRQDSVCKTALHDIAVTLATSTGFSYPTIWANWGENIAGSGDFNNDGKDEIVFFDTFWGKAYVGLSNGANFGAVISWGSIAGYSGELHACRYGGATISRVADFNGDGRADLLCYVPTDPGRQFVALSQNTNFDTYVYSELDCPIYDPTDVDTNADGVADLICKSTNGDLRTLQVIGGFVDTDALTGFCTASEFSFGDWNGDGTSDAACANNGRAALRTGQKFVELAASTSYCVSGQRLAADLDGDGSAEWICNNPGAPGNDIEIRRWNGLAFGAATTWHGGFCAGTISAADFNGDGKKDLLCTSSGAVIYAGTKNVKADLLVGSANGIGGSSTLTWGTITNSAQNATGGASTAGLPAKYIVVSTTANDGRTTPKTTTFLYRDGAQDEAERKFFGFGRVVEFLPNNPGETDSLRVIRTFKTDKLLAGRLDAVSRWSFGASAKILSHTKYHYVTSETTGPGARRTALLDSVEEEKYDGTTPAACTTWSPCANGRRTRTEYTYDVYGNLTVAKNLGDVEVTGDEVTTENLYSANISAYIVGLPGRSNQYAGTDLSGDLLTSVASGYDGASWWETPPAKGDRTMFATWIKAEDRWVSNWAAYDDYGNVIGSADPTNKQSWVAYDTTYHLFPTSASNGAGETTFTSWDYVCGVPATTTDPNGVTTTFATDALCRPTTTALPSPYGTVETRSYLSLGLPGTQKVRVETPGPDGTPDWSESYFDGFGRTWLMARRGPSANQPILVDFDYDLRGNLRAKTAPYYANETPKITTFEFDGFDRRTKTTLPDGSFRLTAFPALSEGYFKVVETNELNQSSASKFDALGQLRKSEKTTAQGDIVTTRTYDLLGRLVELKDPQDNTWSYTYDSLGRLMSKSDPDAGASTYTYDDAARVLSQKDAKLQTTTFEYDTVGRLQYRKIRPTGGPTGAVTEYVETVYGTSAAAHNKGRVTQVTTRNSGGVEQSGKLAFEYDVLGRVTRQTRTIDGVNYVVEKNFDTAGYLRGIKYPDNDILGQFGGSGSALAYDGAGRLSTIPGILTSVTYNALGAPLVQTNANGTTTTKTYDPNRFWLTDIDTTAPSLVLQNLHYTPNNAGMVTAVDSDISNEDWTYSYDELNRLTSSTNGAAGNDQTWAYDSLGRFTSNSRVGTTFTYPGSGAGSVRPHAPASISGGPLGSLTFSYDGNGNLASGNGRSYSWNANNQITQVIANSSTTTFTYGPDGDRIKKASGATVAKYPFGDDYEIDAGGTVTKYFNAGFGPIAKKVGTTLFWLHTDRLGSINASTDAGGAQVLRRSYRAYGGLLAQSGTAAVSEFATVGNPGTSKQVTVNRTGRYVRIQLPGTNYLHMAEVQVWSSGVNVALGKAATQSSTWAPGVGVAGVAVDGSPGPGVTHTLLNLEPWWEVDLGAEYSISSVTVWNRTDCCQERLSDFSVFVSTTPFTSTSMAITRLSSSESLSYIGQRTDSETGLTYLHARYYDSALGIFLSPDPAEADRNTYRYSFGDPVNFSDPSGLDPQNCGGPQQIPCNEDVDVRACEHTGSALGVTWTYWSDCSGDQSGSAGGWSSSFWNYMNNHNYPGPGRRARYYFERPVVKPEPPIVTPPIVTPNPPTNPPQGTPADTPVGNPPGNPEPAQPQIPVEPPLFPSVCQGGSFEGAFSAGYILGVNFGVRVEASGLRIFGGVAFGVGVNLTMMYSRSPSRTGFENSAGGVSNPGVGLAGQVSANTYGEVSGAAGLGFGTSGFSGGTNYVSPLIPGNICR